MAAEELFDYFVIYSFGLNKNEARANFIFYYIYRFTNKWAVSFDFQQAGYLEGGQVRGFSPGSPYFSLNSGWVIFFFKRARRGWPI